MMDMPPYQLHFQYSPNINCTVLNKLPSWCLYTLRSAQSSVHKVFDHADLLVQQLTIPPLHLEVIQLNTKVPFAIQCETKKSLLSLFFMLKGGIDFQSAEGGYIVSAREKQFYLTYNRPELFTARYSPGKHIAIFVRMPLRWVLQVCSSYPNLNKMINCFLKKRKPFRPMPHCKVDIQVHHWLEEIFSYTSSNVGVLDGLLRMRLAFILEHYDTLVEKKLKTLPYLAKNYLRKHFRDKDLCTSLIAAYYSATERTLRNQFKKEFGVTPHDYYTSLRMQYAERLIKVGNRAVKEVYMEVGYKDESTFRYMYNKYLHSQ